MGWGVCVLGVGWVGGDKTRSSNNYLYYFTIITNIVILSTSFLSRLGKTHSIAC